MNRSKNLADLKAKVSVRKAGQLDETPRAALYRQLATLEQARNNLQAAVDQMTGSINWDEATWVDVAKFAQLVDRVRNSGIFSE